MSDKLVQIDSSSYENKKRLIECFVLSLIEPNIWSEVTKYVFDRSPEKVAQRLGEKLSGNPRLIAAFLNDFPLCVSELDRFRFNASKRKLSQEYSLFDPEDEGKSDETSN